MAVVANEAAEVIVVGNGNLLPGKQLEYLYNLKLGIQEIELPGCIWCT